MRWGYAMLIVEPAINRDTTTGIHDVDLFNTEFTMHYRAVLWAERDFVAVIWPIFLMQNKTRATVVFSLICRETDFMTDFMRNIVAGQNKR